MFCDRVVLGITEASLRTCSKTLGQLLSYLFKAMMHGTKEIFDSSFFKILSFLHWVKILKSEIMILQVTVGFTLFGKETLADLNLKEITTEIQ